VRGLRENAEALHRLSAAAGHDPARLLSAEREQVAALVEEGQDRFARANPASRPSRTRSPRSW
jgi:hypothetical protein